MGGKHSRDKGIRGELEVVKILQEFYPGCSRTSERQRSRACKDPDIIGGGIERDFYVEVKRYKKLTSNQIEGFIVRAKKDRESYNPNIRILLFYRTDNNKWYVIGESLKYSDNNGALLWGKSWSLLRDSWLINKKWKESG